MDSRDSIQKSRRKEKNKTYIVMFMAIIMTLGVLMFLYRPDMSTASRDHRDKNDVVTTELKTTLNQSKVQPQQPTPKTQQLNNTHAMTMPNEPTQINNIWLANGAVNPSPQRLASFQTPNMSILCPPGEVGIEARGGNQVLLKIRKGVRASKESTVNSSVRVLCMIYTYSGGHKRVKHIANTWGRECDGFIAASNVTEHSIGAFDLPIQGEHNYGNMWQKVRHMWQYVWQHYRESYDYFHVCGDDVYIAVNNLRAYLGGPQVQYLLNGGIDAFSRRRQFRRATKLRPRPLLLGCPMLLK